MGDLPYISSEHGGLIIRQELIIRTIRYMFCSYLLGLNLLHDAHCLNDKFHSNWRPLQCPDFHHITFVQGLQAGQCSILGGGEEGGGLDRERGVG